MKRIAKECLLSVFAMILIVSLSGCLSSRKGVPDGVLQLLVDDYIDSIVEEREEKKKPDYYYFLKEKTGDYFISDLNFLPIEYEYSYSVSHDIDSKANIDTVIITLEETQKCYKVVYQGEFTYQYDKSGDNWKLVRDKGWEIIYPDSREGMCLDNIWYSEALIVDRFIGEWDGEQEILQEYAYTMPGYTYTLTITDISDDGFVTFSLDWNCEDSELYNNNLISHISDIAVIEPGCYDENGFYCHSYQHDIPRFTVDTGDQEIDFYFLPCGMWAYSSSPWLELE